MADGERIAPALRILLGVVGLAGILLGLFLIAVASFADGSTGERVVTIAIAVGIAVLGGLVLPVLPFALDLEKPATGEGQSHERDARG